MLYLLHVSTIWALALLLKDSLVLEQLLNEVNVRHDHPSTAVSVQSQLVHRVAIANIVFEEL
jgi:hypothetical protein